MQRKQHPHRTGADAKRGAVAVLFAIALGWSHAAMAEGIRCTQEGLWGARCSDGRGNVVGGDLAAKDGNLLSFGRGDSSRCSVDAAGNPTCNINGKTFGAGSNLPGTTQAREGTAKALRCTSNGLGVQHCTDGGWLGQKCVSDGTGGSRCSWEWPVFGTN
jgi:hypothetical protein